MTREKAIQVISNIIHDDISVYGHKDKPRNIALAMAIEALRERPHGEWIYNQYDGNANIGNWHCSECRHIVYGGYSQKPYYNFCPNCGADMRKMVETE